MASAGGKAQVTVSTSESRPRCLVIQNHITPDLTVVYRATAGDDGHDQKMTEAEVDAHVHNLFKVLWLKALLLDVLHFFLVCSLGRKAAQQRDFQAEFVSTSVSILCQVEQVRKFIYFPPSLSLSE